MRFFATCFYCIVLPVRDFYRQRSAGLAAEESDGVEEVHTRPASATRPAAAAAVTAKSVSYRDATWRAGFALRVYEVMARQPKDYAVVRRQQGTAVGLAYGTLFALRQLSHLALFMTCVFGLEAGALAAADEHQHPTATRAALLVQVEIVHGLIDFLTKIDNDTMRE